jgi:predicted nucleotidyltransferase
MNRDRAIDILRGLRPRLEARGIVHAAIFGSVGRDDAGGASDIDVVVVPEPSRRLDLIDLGGVQTLLDEGFDGVAVDVVVAPVRQSTLREAIERDRVNAF